jgi:hypothetical protein
VYVTFPIIEFGIITDRGNVYLSENKNELLQQAIEKIGSPITDKTKAGTPIVGELVDAYLSEDGKSIMGKANIFMDKYGEHLELVGMSIFKKGWN